LPVILGDNQVQFVCVAVVSHATIHNRPATELFSNELTTKKRRISRKEEEETDREMKNELGQVSFGGSSVLINEKLREYKAALFISSSTRFDIIASANNSTSLLIFSS
jgi:hypothetical protein